MSASFNEILESEQIKVMFQPIISLDTGKLIGFEGFARGPSDSALHPFQNLSESARQEGKQLELEELCHRNILNSFSLLSLPGYLFLNTNPGSVARPGYQKFKLKSLIEEAGLPQERVIVELTELRPGYSEAFLVEAISEYQAQHFKISLDDLGDWFSSFRLWLQFKPEFVKVDRYFIQGVASDPVKQAFIHSMNSMAEKAGTKLIAEGIENVEDLMMAKKVGIQYAQGHYIARPSEDPYVTFDLSELALGQETVTKKKQTLVISTDKQVVAMDLLSNSLFVSTDFTNEEIYTKFNSDPNLYFLPVVNDDFPIGLISRLNLIDKFSRPFGRDLYGKKSCSTLVDANPLIVDAQTPIQELSQRVLDQKHQCLIDGFLITENGKFLGMGTTHDLMRLITQMQIDSASYANPLTHLPGNVPINQKTNQLLKQRKEFVCCYFDLDHFKPFNDYYGFDKGDGVILLIGEVIKNHVHPEKDFLGHIGGDDFICLFQSEDWETRCHRMLEEFDQRVATFFPAEDVQRGGYFAEDRRGNTVFHPLLTVSTGALPVHVDSFSSYQEIAHVATGTKKMAKKIQGSSLYIEQRKYGKGKPGCPGQLSECNLSSHEQHVMETVHE